MMGTVDGSRSRRLSASREFEILDAAVRLLALRGYEALTMDEVAAAARMSKATLYRQWQGKAGLVAAALRHIDCGEPATVDTGSLRGDLLAFASAMPQATEERMALFAGLVHAGRSEPSLQALINERIVAPTLSAVEALFRRAIARGEIPAEHPLAGELGRLLVYAAYGQILLEGLVPDEEYLLGLIDGVVLPLLALAPRPSADVTHQSPPPVARPATRR